MKSCLLVRTLIASTLGLTACASTAVQVGYWHRDPEFSVYVFGGAYLDVAAVVGSLSAGGEGSIGALLIFDLPFSLAADVLLLPLCVYEQIERTTWGEDEFIEQLGDPDAESRCEAAAALGALERTTGATVDALTKALADEDPRVRQTVLRSLGRLGARSAGAAPAVLPSLGDADPRIRADAADVLGVIGADPDLVLPALIEALHDPEARVRYRAVVALTNTGIKTAPAIEALERALHDEADSVREAARRSLARLR